MGASVTPRSPVTVQVHRDSGTAASAVADEIEGLLRDAGRRGARLVLGLPTGASSEPVYVELVRRHRERDLSFAGADVFLVDEYWPLAADHPQSFRRFLRKQFVSQVDLDPARVATLDGGLPQPALAAECQRFEEALAAAGGMELALLGLGRNGHVAFDEPGSAPDSRTRLVGLAASTRADAASGFGGLARVPHHALTMGLATLRAARRLRVLAFGAHKAAAVAALLRGPPTPELPVSLLRGHADLTLILDRAAAATIGGIPPASRAPS